MKRWLLILSLVLSVSSFAGNNPTNPNTSYKNRYPKGSKSGSKAIRKDQVNRNYKQQGTLQVNRSDNKNITTGKSGESYKHPQGLR